MQCNGSVYTLDRSPHMVCLNFEKAAKAELLMEAYDGNVLRVFCDYWRFLRDLKGSITLYL